MSEGREGRAAIVFEVGDCVRLASGGPAMTVTALAADGSQIECAWFPEDGTGVLMMGSFIAATLKLVID